MRESNVMLVHYATGVLIIALVAIHLATRILIPFEESIRYGNIVLNFKNLLYAAVLQLLLVTVAVHGFNGLRVVLMELRQGATWEKAVNWLVLILGVAFVALGTNTIVVVNLLQ